MIPVRAVAAAPHDGKSDQRYGVRRRRQRGAGGRPGAVIVWNGQMLDHVPPRLLSHPHPPIVEGSRSEPDAMSESGGLPLSQRRGRAKLGFSATWIWYGRCAGPRAMSGRRKRLHHGASGGEARSVGGTATGIVVVTPLVAAP